MSESHKPLFNRTYLKVIIWIVAIAIILLTTSQNSSIDFISIKKHDSAPVYYVDSADAPYLQINLLYRTGPAISEQQQLLQQLLGLKINDALAQITQRPEFTEFKARFKAETEADRINVRVVIPKDYSEQTQQISTMIKALQQDLSEALIYNSLEKSWNRLEAKQYLNQKDPENLLLSTFLNQLNPDPSVHPLQRFDDLYRARINPTTLTITVQGPESRALAQLLGQALPNYSSNDDFSRPPGTPNQLSLAPQGNSTYMLAGLELPGRQQANFLNELLAVRTLQQLLQSQEAKFRLIWKSLDKQGYIAMILHGPQVTANTDLYNLLQPLKAQLSDQLIDKTRAQLQDKFNNQMAQTQAQLGQLESIAFYQLPVDYLDQFSERLERVDNQQVKQLINRYLDSSQQYQLILPAY